MKTYMANARTVERKWYVVDATNVPLGRLASKVASILRGKNKPTFTPNVDTGDFVIIVNSDKALLTGKKLENKFYRYHTGYIGGLKEVPYSKMMAERSDLAVCYFDTDYFETADGEYDEALANAFIEDFTANLVAAGFVETEGKEALNNNAIQYTKDGISISITRYYADWSGIYLSYLRVMVRVDDATRLVDHSDY